MPSIKTNFAYKSLLTISNYLMAFITFPYISRVLGVENIGLVNFVDNTINYFLLFATLGVGVLGVREIARVKNDRNERNIVFSNILGINLFFTLITIAIYIVAITIIPKFNQYSELFYIGSSKILFTVFLVEWFYTGMEEFKYITIRSLIIKSIYVISVFVLINDVGDYKLYFYLTLSVTLINSVINLIHSRGYVRVIPSELINFRFIRENLTLGIYQLMTSMYLTFNVMYLGLVSDNVQVGYYTTAYKLYSVILGFFTAFTNVMLPRMSSLIANQDNEYFEQLIKKSFSMVIIFSIPLIACSIVLAPDIVYVLSGPGYDGAIVPMRIIMPAVIFVGIAQVLAIQILMPLKKDKVLLYTSIIGAFTSITINFLFVGHMQSIGSSIVLLCSELVVTLSYIVYIITKTEFRFRWSIIVNSLVYSLPSILICVYMPTYINNRYLALLVTILCSILVWGIIIHWRRKVISLFL